MTLTRLAFFKLLAAVGIGQATYIPKCSEVTNGKTPCVIDAPCEKGEERCPLGHCQKPRYIAMNSVDLLVEPADEEEVIEPQMSPTAVPAIYHFPQPYTIERINQHVCSVCQIVYVPRS